MYSKSCPVCGGTITTKYKSQLKKQRTCSHSCQLKNNKHRQGHRPSNAFTTDDVIGENNVNWKGNKAKYGTIHDWVNYHRGKPCRCEHCNTSDKSARYDWANISGKYKRDLNDWIRLCRKCHFNFDKDKHPRSNKGFKKA